MSRIPDKIDRFRCMQETNDNILPSQVSDLGVLLQAYTDALQVEALAHHRTDTQVQFIG